MLVRWDRIVTVYISGDEITVRTTRRALNESRCPAWIVPNDFVLATVAETLIRDAASATPRRNPDA